MSTIFSDKSKQTLHTMASASIHGTSHLKTIPSDSELIATNSKHNFFLLPSPSTSILFIATSPLPSPFSAPLHVVPTAYFSIAPAMQEY